MVVQVTKIGFILANGNPLYLRIERDSVYKSELQSLSLSAQDIGTIRDYARPYLMVEMPSLSSRETMVPKNGVSEPCKNIFFLEYKNAKNAISPTKKINSLSVVTLDDLTRREIEFLKKENILSATPEDVGYANGTFGCLELPYCIKHRGLFSLV